MHKIIPALLFLSLSGTSLFSQDYSRSFDIKLPKNKVQNSLYKTISLLDSRVGNKDIGIINVGLFKNAEAKLTLKTPLQDQLASLMHALTDSSAGDGELLFQLHWLRFAETSGTRYCYLIASLYAKTGEHYEKLAAIDTVLRFKIESWNLLVTEESNIISNFIAGNLLKQAKDTVTYSIGDIAHIDSIEKQKIPVFATENYKDGLYKNYQSFKTQMPENQAMVKADKDGTISSVRVVDSNGAKVKIHPKNVYALVYKGQPYIATPHGFYTLQKSADNNFYFTGDIDIAASQGEISGGYVAFGVVGALLASGANQETFVVMIDYRNGGFIHLQRVIQPE
jgi:hypothetical protein